MPRVGPLLLTLTLGFVAISGACGDRAGEPVVLSEPSVSGDGSGGSSGGGEGNFGGEEGAPAEANGGLCTPCDSGRDCGDQDDYCLEGPDQEAFCSRDCAEGDGCPIGYECHFVDNADETQCVPISGSCEHIALKPPPAMESLRMAALAYVNDLRFDYGLAPLESDACLTAIAQQSAFELADTGDYLGMYERECEGMNDCECGWSGEAEATVAAFDLHYDDVVERAIQQNLSESPNGNFSRVLFSDQFDRVGVGIVLSGDEGFAALSFGD